MNDNDNEIKNEAKLTVRQSQVAVFVNEGKIADLVHGGMYELTTQNLPILSTLKAGSMASARRSRQKCTLLTAHLHRQQMGHEKPIMLRDPEFGPIRLRAFGNFSIRVNDPKKLLEEIVGTDGHFTVDEINAQLKPSPSPVF